MLIPHLQTKSNILEISLLKIKTQINSQIVQAITPAKFKSNRSSCILRPIPGATEARISAMIHTLKDNEHAEFNPAFKGLFNKGR
jgi:hypothetical protein